MMMAMRHRTLAIAAAAGALAVGGTAVATGAGGFVGGDREQHDAQLAKDLASKLNGVSAADVQTALGQVRDERRAAHLKQESAALAAELDGVSQADVQKALTKLEAKHERAEGSRRGRDFRPRRDGFAADLAKELGKPTAEVRKALRAARTKQFQAQLDQAVKDGRLTQAQADKIKKRFESGPPGFGRGRGGHGPHGPGGPGPHGPGGPGPGGPGFGGPGFGGPPPGDGPPDG
jgi:hypothetical protein